MCDLELEVGEEPEGPIAGESLEEEEMPEPDLGTLDGTIGTPFEVGFMGG